MSPVILFWLILLIVSVAFCALLAKRIGPRQNFPLFVLLILSILNLAAFATLVYLFTAPSEPGVSIQQQEAKVYVFAEVASGLIILLLILLPPTLMLWLKRLRRKPKQPP